MRQGLALLAFVGLSLAHPARADEKEWTLALDPGFAALKIPAGWAWGGGGGVDVSYGVTDALAVRVTGAYTAHHLDEQRDPMTMRLTQPGGLVTAYHAGAGVTWAIDVLRFVPSFDLSIGLLGTTSPVLSGSSVVTRATYDFGVEIGLAVDYLVNRRVSVGAFVRYHAYLTSLTNIPVYLYAGPRLAIHFGG